MSLRHHRLAPGGALGGALCLALVLSACQKQADNPDNANAMAAPALPATLPMANTPPQQAALAPPPAALPRAHRIRTVRVADPRSAYAYADQASYFSQSLGDAPPDYGFSYEDVRPWAWQGYDGSRTFVEPVAGGYRTYYYRPGADRPYFVRDPEYAYGYDGDQLAAVYGPDGALIPYDSYGPRETYAAAYLWRAQRLYEASRERQAVSAAAWVARQEAIIAARDQWAANRERQAEWAAYHAQEAAQESRYWAQESQRRAEDQQRFAQWRAQDFRTPPPPRAIPPRWQQARWAQDSTRYAPVATAAVAGGMMAALMPRHRQDAPPPPPVPPPPPMAPSMMPRPAIHSPSSPAGPAPAPRQAWHGQPGAWQQPIAPPPPQFHKAQAVTVQHGPRGWLPPATVAHQRPGKPAPDVGHREASFRQTSPHAPAMPQPGPNPALHREKDGMPHGRAPMARPEVHRPPVPAPVARPSRPPEVHSAPPATVTRPTMPAPHHEVARQPVNRPVESRPPEMRPPQMKPPETRSSAPGRPTPGQPERGHPGGADHHDHH